jgi:hypothetical protein
MRLATFCLMLIPAPSLNVEISKSKSVTKLSSKKRLACLGLIDYRQGDRFIRKIVRNQTIKEVLHRPFEPAGLTGSCCVTL